MRKVKSMSIKELREKHNGKLYVYCKDQDTEQKFLCDAEAEGFMFGNQKPTENHAANIIAVEDDMKLAHVGAIGRMAYQSGACVRVDYSKYISGAEDYII